MFFSQGNRVPDTSTSLQVGGDGAAAFPCPPPAARGRRGAGGPLLGGRHPLRAAAERKRAAQLHPTGPAPRISDGWEWKGAVRRAVPRRWLQE